MKISYLETATLLSQIGQLLSIVSLLVPPQSPHQDQQLEQPDGQSLSSGVSLSVASWIPGVSLSDKQQGCPHHEILQWRELREWHS